jgi:hypothetical protein
MFDGNEILELFTAVIIWLLSFFILPKLEDQKDVNLVQRINFGTINVILYLLLLKFYFSQ